MKFHFDKPTCRNLRKSLRKEWLETNGLGDYASGSLSFCNTRRYHGLLTVNLEQPEGRHVLLSTVEESLLAGGREFLFSCRKHPGLYYPHGHEYLQSMETGLWPRFEYRIGDLVLTRELMLLPKQHLLLMRYLMTCAEADAPSVTLRIKPLLAFRHFHALTCANMDLQVKTFPAASGFKVQPYNALPSLFMQVEGDFRFHPSPDWCRDVEYLVEEERGFPFREDLFQPGIFDIVLQPGVPVFLTASVAEQPAGPGRFRDLWRQEETRRLAVAPEAESLEGHLAAEGAKFLIVTPQGRPAVLAGYHWFDAWGRDTLIALPGLTFFAGRIKEGTAVLKEMAASVRDGLIPNCFAADGVHHAYNSVDASLWFVWALQQLFEAAPEQREAAQDWYWPAVKSIVDAYSGGRVPHVRMDEDGLLCVGDATTQLTWMDAAVNGVPVTPRHGYPVEINALWYNTLAFSRRIARERGETDRIRAERLHHMQEVFVRRFLVQARGGYLADVWRPEGADTSIRPNQLFAVSLPFPILEEEYQAGVVELVRKTLLTPCGLRTLSPDHPAYCSHYAGPPEVRDRAYHQGTVWPWLLGAYADALFRTTWDAASAARSLLTTLRPLFAQHLGDAGMGSVSEIFAADPPFLPDGTVAQAWSVAECLRLLRLVQRKAPEVYALWEADARKGGKACEC